MASYSVVKTYAEQKEAIYKGMPWESKESFATLTEYFLKNN